MQVRTFAALLIWIVAALLILNAYFKSEWILAITIAATVIAIVIYFSPQLRKRFRSYVPND